MDKTSHSQCLYRGIQAHDQLHTLTRDNKLRFIADQVHFMNYDKKKHLKKSVGLKTVTAHAVFIYGQVSAAVSWSSWISVQWQSLHWFNQGYTAVPEKGSYCNNPPHREIRFDLNCTGTKIKTSCFRKQKEITKLVSLWTTVWVA